MSLTESEVLVGCPLTILDPSEFLPIESTGAAWQKQQYGHGSVGANICANCEPSWPKLQTISAPSSRQ
jgi:hypothetical protein